jgi:Cdc6-like AAA superfamily ATPase
MAKGSTGPAVNTVDVHLIIQGKGGIGKTATANILAQYLNSNGQHAQCYDTDPVNASLFRFKALNANRVEVMEDGQVKELVFDSLIEAICTGDGPFVVDTGATTFIPLWSYVVQNQIIRLLEQQGRRVFVHVVVAGGQSQLDTLQGLGDIAKSLSDRRIVIWLNEFFGKITTPDGRPFEEMRVYQDNADKILGAVVIPDRNRNTFGEDMRRMLTNALTFDEAIQSDTFGIVSKQRLRIVREDLFGRLAAVNWTVQPA